MFPINSKPPHTHTLSMCDSNLLHSLSICSFFTCLWLPKLVCTFVLALLKADCKEIPGLPLVLVDSREVSRVWFTATSRKDLMTCKSTFSCSKQDSKMVRRWRLYRCTRR